MILNYDKRYSKIEFSRMQPIDLYKLILNGKFYNKFLNKYWDRADKLEISALFVRYLYEEVLHFKKNEIIKRCSKSLLKRYKLDSMVEKVINNDIFAVIDNAYPNVIV